MSCRNFIAHTFTHWLGAVGLTALGTQYVLIPVENKGVNFLLILALLVTLVIQEITPPGVIKYIIFGVFILLMGQFLRPLEQQLNQQGLLTEVFVMTAGIFIPMVLLGFYDNTNILPWTSYLFVSLLGLIFARLVLYGLALTGYYSDKQITNGSKIISSFAVALFALLTSWDVNIIRKLAKTCKSNPDYVNASMGLFLDVVNLFTGSSDLLSN